MPPYNMRVTAGLRSNLILSHSITRQACRPCFIEGTGLRSLGKRKSEANSKVRFEKVTSRLSPHQKSDCCRILPMLPVKFQPIRLSRRAEPFNSSDFIYEIKHDGFRAFACVRAGECQLVSRNGNVFRGLAECIGRRLKVDAVLDGEIVVLDEYGRSQFNALFEIRSK